MLLIRNPNLLYGLRCIRMTKLLSNGFWATDELCGLGGQHGAVERDNLARLLVDRPYVGHFNMSQMLIGEL